MISRICLFGRPGSGKSTFALKLHEKIQLPLYHLDKFFFQENWQERNYQEFINIQKSLINTEQWIIDGNSLQSIEMRYSRAEIVLYFNYPRLTCLYRLFKRLLFKHPNILDRAPGCRENVRWQLIKYMWTFDSRLNYRLTHQLKYLKHQYPHVVFWEIHDDEELKKVFNLICKSKGIT